MTAALDERANPKEPYGPASQAHYADPGYQSDGKKRYPLSDEAKCRAAWSYINMPKNAAMYSAEQLSEIKGRIKAAGKKYGIDFADSRSDEPEAEYRRDLPAMCVRAFDFEATDTEGDGRTLEGYAAVFGRSARISARDGDFDETIAPGAFTRSLQKRLPVMQFEHGRDPRVGAVPIAAIENIREDGRGLFVRARLFDNPVVEPVRQAIVGKAIPGMSFRFQVRSKSGEKWDRGGYGVPDRREVRDADVFEVGPVVFPAYDHTTISVRSLLSGMAEEERRALVHELADELRLAVDLTDLTGQSVARSADGGEPDATTQEREASSAPQHMTIRQRLDDGALQARGIK